MQNDAREWFYDGVIALKDDMFRFAFSILRNTQDCEDAVGNAMIQAYEHIGQLRKRDAFRVWYTKIVRNECYRILKERKRSAAICFNTEGTVDGRSCESIDVQNALFRLPTDRRIALTLYYLCGYSVAEIAEVLQVPAGTVKSRLSRARSEMKQILGGTDYAQL